MLRKLRDFPLVAYISVKGFIQSVKEDERGLSGVAVAVLLVLVAIFAVILLWGYLKTWIGQLWQRITDTGGELNR